MSFSICVYLFLKFAGFLGIIGSILGLVAVFLATVLCGVECSDTLEGQFAASWRADGSFSWEINALSDLGVSEVADIFNYSLILVGILNFVFAVGFMKAYAGTRASFFSVLLLIIGGVCLSFIGVFTEAYGVLHFVVSSGFFIFFPISIILIGVTFVSSSNNGMRYFSVLVGALALITISSYFTGIFRTLGYGFSVPEYISAAIISTWVIYMGINLIYYKPK